MIAPIGKNCIPCPSKVASDHTNLALTHCAGLPILVGLAARDLDRGSLARLARRRVARGRGGQGLSLPGLLSTLEHTTTFLLLLKPALPPVLLLCLLLLVLPLLSS